MKKSNIPLYLFAGAVVGAFLIGSVGLLVGTLHPVGVSLIGAGLGAVVAAIYGLRNNFA
jgi:hypothetical protein